MKHSILSKFLISTVFILSGFASFSQSVAISDGSSAHASAMLEVKSVVKGFLPPRMLEAQRNAIVTPAAGLTVWCTDCGTAGEMQVYNGTTWTNMTGGAASSNNSPTVTFCGFIWDRNNLDVTTYRDLTPIPEVTNPATWAGLTTGAWCYYQNNTANGTVYGKLYNWYAVNNTVNGGLAPTGWRIPTDAEWTTLESCLNGAYPGNGGGALKETGTVNWQTPNAGATNQTGFKGLPGGQRQSDGTFIDKGITGNMWSKSVSPFDPNLAVCRFLWFNDGNIYFFEAEKKVGYSVRLIKD